jgi:hypothetical protein
MPHGYFYDTSTNIAVTTDSNTFSTVFNTDYPGNQITGFQLNGVDIGSMITPFVDLTFSTANNYQYLIKSNNINTSFSFIKPKPTVTVTNCASISTFGLYTLYEYHNGSVGTFQLNISIPNIVLDLNVLLIGGGGAGGHYYNSSSGGAGGGGAGSYVTTIIKAPAYFSSSTNVQFNINVGGGGAGTNNGNSSGSSGSSSSITYVNTLTNYINGTSITTTNTYSLTAGGGGSGGSVNNTQGIRNSNGFGSNGFGSNVNGSTGGACGIYPQIQYFNASGTDAGYSTTDSNGSIFTAIASSLNRGGNTYYVYGGGGGGGAGGQGQDVGGLPGGNGGAGKTWINNVTYAGGGGGGPSPFGNNNGDSAGGSGGGGPSAVATPYQGNAAANTGSGGGAGWTYPSGNGGSGICIIAVKTSDIIVPTQPSECAQS